MLKIDIDDREVHQAIEDLRRRTSYMRPALRAIGDALMDGSRERILAGKDWTGQAFAPNAESTLLRAMRRATGDKGLLTKRGNTRMAAVRALARKKPLIDQKDFVTSRLFYQAEADRVTVGASAVQAAVLQFGAKAGAFGATRRSAACPSTAVGRSARRPRRWCQRSFRRIWRMSERSLTPSPPPAGMRSCADAIVGVLP